MSNGGSEGNWRSEFPLFPVEDMPEIPENWVDTSWRNDASPSFVAMNKRKGDESARYERMRIWINEADPSMRESPLASRFIISYEGDAIDENVDFHFEDWQEVLEFVNVRVDLANEYSREVGYNPFLDEPNLTPEEVRQTLQEYAEEAAKKPFP